MEEHIIMYWFAYDYGLADVGDGISPSENNFVIRLDESEEVVEITKNVVIVKPHQFCRWLRGNRM